MIDSHQHFWKYSEKEYAWISRDMGVLKRDFLPPDLEAEAKPRGINGCVAVQARASLEETRWLLEQADRHPFIRGVVGWLDLLKPDVTAQLQPFLKQLKLKGLRYGVQDETDEGFMMRKDFLHGAKAVLDAGLAYDILIVPPQLPQALAFASHFSGTRLVLDHMAKPLIKAKATEPWATNILELGKLPHVHCKVSGMVTEADHQAWKEDDFRAYLDIVLEAFGPGRLMFGSDWPVCLLAADYRQVFSLASILAERLNPEEQKSFFGGTAERFYKLT